MSFSTRITCLSSYHSITISLYMYFSRTIYHVEYFGDLKIGLCTCGNQYWSNGLETPMYIQYNLKHLLNPFPNTEYHYASEP